ncbi:MAG: cytochrome c biogenesis protein CcsA, partial [Bacteroidales bacterium]|nr:cytochrome c biogenesis protein CcsA [Bacteroidales bacterium]
MNNILKYKGYRFYQSSFDQADEKGTTLSVNNDAFGTGITYVGYFLMIVSILLSMLAPGSRFVRLIKDSAKPVKIGAMLILLSIGLSLQAQNTPPVSKLMQQEAKEFGKIWVQGSDGRFEPVNTLAQELTRKIFKQNRYGDLSAEEFWLSILLDPVKWEAIPLFELERPELSVMLGIRGAKAAFSDFFQGNQYKLKQLVDEAVRKRPTERSAMDKSIIKLDEQLNVFYLCINGQYLRIFPDLRDSNARWFDLASSVKGLPEKDSLFINTAFGEYLNSIDEGNTSMSQKWREAITQYQEQYGSEVLPAETKAKLEILYNRMLVFERLAPFYATIGLILLIIQFLAMFKPKKWQAKLTSGLAVLFGLGFILHTIGLAVRWYVSGHAPMSNGYESMIFVAWGTLLAGLILMKRSKMALALTAVLAALSLLVAHLSWMSPEMTPLMPVLKSPWLTIHVAVIMTSYSFLGLGALISFVVMIMYISKTKKNHELVDRHISHLTKMNKIVLIVGLYLITIGCFLGAIWANVSWGRYWGWDPKETWCLISILIYSFVNHMHHIKGMKNDFSFNLGSLLSFASILMTYFGVNYFLSGMHSYGGGATPEISIGIYVALILIIATVYWAYFSQQRFDKK